MKDALPAVSGIVSVLFVVCDVARVIDVPEVPPGLKFIVLVISVL